MKIILMNLLKVNNFVVHTYPAMFCLFSWSTFTHFYFVFVGLPTTDTPSPAARRKTNYLTGKPSITKTISMESGSNMDPNEIKLAGM